MNSKLDVDRIFSLVDNGSGIPTISPIMKKLVDSQHEDESGEYLATIIQRDPALLVRVVQAYTDFDKNEDRQLNLNKMLKKLGDEHVRNLLLSTDFIESDFSSEAYRAHLGLWERSLFTSIAAKKFSQYLGFENSMELANYGLIFDLGALFLLTHFSETYLPVLDSWRSTGGFLTAHERDQLGIDHGTVGQYLLRRWKINNKYVKLFSSDVTIDSTDDADVSLLQLAKFAGGAFYGAFNKERVKEVYKISKDKFEIEEDSLTGLMQDIGSETEEYLQEVITDAVEITSMDLLKSINIELGKATHTYDQIVKELRIAIQKSEDLAEKLKEANQKLKESANIDPLTNVYNRRYFQEFIQWNFSRAKRYKTTIGCMMIDIDHFKQVNDKFGHLTGDRVLQEVASRLHDTLRSSDILARFGGEEFIVLLPETNPESVRLTADRLLHCISDKTIEIPGDQLFISVSVGYYAYNGADSSNVDSAEDLVNAADKNMYMAKKNGRNRVYPTE